MSLGNRALYTNEIYPRLISKHVVGDSEPHIFQVAYGKKIRNVGMEACGLLLATSLTGYPHEPTPCSIILVADVEKQSFNVLR